MGEGFCYLITVIHNDTLLRVALKTDLYLAYPMEADSRKRLREQLPLHIKSVGQIVEVHEIFDIVINKEN